MPLESLDLVIERYISTLGYSVSGSVADSKLFLVAAMELQIRRPEQVTIDGQVVKFDSRVLSAQIEEARRWIAANDTAATANSSSVVRYYDHSRIRG